MAEDMGHEVILLEKLYDAVDRCEEKKVISLLKEGAFIHKIKAEALTRAAYKNNERMLRFMLDRGAEVNVWTTLHNLTTPLVTAVRYSSPECIQLLLDRGGHVNDPDCGDNTPLSVASHRGNLKIMQLLLDKGAQVHLERNYDGETPLIAAVYSGNVDAAKLLLNWGAQINHQDKKGWTPLMWATHRGHHECAQMLLDRGAVIEDQNKCGQTALMVASSYECAQLLLDKGANANITDNQGWSPLMLASSKGHDGCLRALLERGVCADIQDKQGWSPLMLASSNGHDGCLRALLERGVCADIQDKDGNTPLMMAVEKKTLKCVKVLLDKGVDTNLQNKSGNTPLMKVAEKGLFNFMEVLLDKGADINRQNKAIINFSKPKATRFMKRVLGRQDVLEPLTAGIIPHQVDSSYSNMVVYDLAGHHEFFSSHSACLEAISLDSPAIFLLLQDLRKDPEVMTKEVYYWSTMIDGVCHKCPEQSGVIVVGTHADLITEEQLVAKVAHLNSVAKLAVTHQKLLKICAMNLNKLYSQEMKTFKDILQEACNTVIHMSPPTPVHCNLMLAFLNERLPHGMDAITLADLAAHLCADPDKAIRANIPQLITILKTLSERGLIVFIPSEDPLQSWIVIRKESILKKVNGALFADPSLKEYRHLGSSTGIIRRSVLEAAFPEYNIDMITQFMIHFELCQSVDLSKIDTNMAPEGSDLGPLLFFPALVSADRPGSATVPANSFGWSMIVKCTNQFFTPRFLHVLLRRLPTEFALPALQASSLHSHCRYYCDVWRRGIKWLSEAGVTTIVEMNETFQSLSLAMSTADRTDPKYLEIARAVLAVVKKACQEFCPHLEVLEVISCPSEASSDHSDDTKVELSSLKTALLEKEKQLADVNWQKRVVMEEWMKIEPCLPQLIEAAAATSSSVMSLAPPLCLSQLIKQTVSPLEDRPTMPSIVKMNIAASVGSKYMKFGASLLEDTNGDIMAALKRECKWNAEQINTAILQMWLEGRGMRPRAWSTLVAVLQSIEL